MDQLTDLVLFEVLAALPMQQVVRLMRVGSPRLQRLCSKKWVTDRMTEVDFRVACVAHQVGGTVRDTFTSPSVLKRMQGKITVDIGYLRNITYFLACLDLAVKVPGKLLLNLDWTCA